VIALKSVLIPLGLWYLSVKKLPQNSVSFTNRYIPR
jgi:hypothetical protein